jgi:fatty acid desaturase
MTRAALADEPKSVEWPTALLAAVIYGGWLALTWFHAALPWWLLAPLGGWFVAWQSSLQHEMVHGHFTPWRRLNYAIAYPPLMLWMPYDRYRATHLAHHRNENLTLAGIDPESRYWLAPDLAALGPLGRALARAENTMLGRVTVGPVWVSLRFLWSEARAIAAGGRDIALAWLKSAPGIALVLAWATLVCGMSVWLYLFAFVLPGTALMLIRSFAEHRAVPAVEQRTVVVEDTPAFALLYLNNNLHATHHRAPGVAWYRLPALHRAMRGELARMGARFYRGYAEVFRRYLLRRHDDLIHPFQSRTA